jgi:hypothetical protein
MGRGSVEFVCTGRPFNHRDTEITEVNLCVLCVSVVKALPNDD